MRALITMIALATTTGCFSFWGLSQVTGTQRAWEQDVREETVPMPGVEERLIVSVPLQFEYEPVPYRPATNPPTPAPKPVAKPFQLTCRVEQRGRDTVYRSAFRYGSRWKKFTAFSFLAETAIASAILLTGDRDQPKVQLWGGALAIDAIGTAAIFFIPRKDVYRKDEKAVITPVRDDCPEGLLLEVGGDSFPVNPLGRIGELGEVALDQWMGQPTGSIQISLEGRTMLLLVGADEQCAWNRAHHPDIRPGCRSSTLPRTTAGAISVPAGTLTAIVADD